MSTKSEILADPGSVFNRAGDDEPLFVIRAHDVVAIAVLEEWQGLRRQAIRRRERPETDFADIQNVTGIIEQMRNWRYQRRMP